MYQALYRKWRPVTFDDVVGQEHITATLKKQVATDRLSHAYLFVGTRGTGKTTCAKILARAVNCEHPVNGNPCNQCASCRGILDGSVLDVVELDAASNNGVDDVRALQDEAIFSPASVKKRVYIVDEVHMLSKPAFNALLKILEEPPEHLMFILCTTELHKVLPTIVSRCQRHSFKRIEAGAISDRLLYVSSQEKIDLEPEAAALLARMADGGMRDALSLLDQCSAWDHIDVDAVHAALGLAGSRRIEELLGHLSARHTDQALTLFDTLWRDGKDPAGILEELGDLLRDVLITKVAPRGGEALLSGIYDKKAVDRFAAQMSGSNVMDAMAAIQSADLAGSDPRRAAEMCLVSIGNPEAGDSLAALKSRVSRLEAALAGAGPIPVPAQSPEPPQRQEPAPVPATKTPAAPAVAEPKPSEPPREELPWDEPPAYSDNDAPPEEWSPAPPAPETPEKPNQHSLKPKPAPVASPAAEPEKASPRAEPAAPQAAGGAGEEQSDVWKELLRRLTGKIDMSSFVFMQSPTQCKGVLRGDVLTVYTSAHFVRTMVDTPAHTALMSQALREILGREVRIVYTEEGPAAGAEPDRSKLEALGKYSNVRFE